MTTTVALLACLASTLYMTGLIWFVQRVHYPLLGELGGRSSGITGSTSGGRARWSSGRWSRSWRRRPSWWRCRRRACPRRLAAVGLAAAGVTWLSTALVQVPLHRRLAAGDDPATLRSLVRTNWVRTAAWTAHAAIALAMTAQALG